MHELSPHERVLDVGGWFKPNIQATHVVDLMPYETRWARLNIDPLPGEKFSKNTWIQVDFLMPSLHLPFDDKFFDFVICGQTVEDLADPAPILTEMMRVGKQGMIESPSRLHEQTIGVRDRSSSKCGHPHHHWVVESDDNKLTFWSKSSSMLESTKNQVHLTIYEHMVRNGSPQTVYHAWRGTINFSLVMDSICADRATSFAEMLAIKWPDRLKDRGLRAARRARNYVQSGTNNDWWPRIVEQSQPFTSIPIS